MTGWARCTLYSLSVALVLSGCIRSSAEVCASGRVCPPGASCDDELDRCLRDDQVAVCVGEDEGAQCEFAGGEGECLSGACTLPNCGDGILSTVEFCEDDQVPLGFSCFDFGYERGVLECSSFCQPDLAACFRTGFHKVFAPTTGNLRGVWGQGDRAWAVGDAGEILLWDGARWTLEERLEGGNLDIVGLNAIWGASPTDVYAVGFAENNAGGFVSAVVHFDGTLWRDIPSPPSGILHAVWGAGTGEIFVAGGDGATGGVVFRLDGSGWTDISPPTANDQLRALWGSGSDDVVAAGDSGLLLRYDGSSWTQVSTTGDELFTGLWGRGPDEIYAVGFEGGAGRQPVMYVWNGVQWDGAIDHGLTEALVTVWGTDDHVIVMGGGGELGIFDGSRWWSPPHPTTADVFAGVALSPGEHLAVGIAGTALRGDGTYFVEEGPGPNSALIDLVAGPGGEVHALVSSGTREELWTYQAGEWRMVEPVEDGAQVRFLWVAGSDDVFVAYSQGGEPGLTRVVDGSPALEKVPPSSLGPVGGIWGSSASDLWLAGRGTVAHYDGANWSTPAVLHDGRLFGIWGSGPSDVYAVGVADGKATIHHYDGSTWSAITDFPEMQLAWDVWGAGPSDVWVAGSKLLHFDGSGWSVVEEAGSGLLVVTGLGPKDVFVGGLSDTLAYFDGERWQRVSVDATANQIAVAGRDVWFASTVDLRHMRWIVPWRCALSSEPCSGWAP